MNKKERSPTSGPSQRKYKKVCKRKAIDEKKWVREPAGFLHEKCGREEKLLEFDQRRYLKIYNIMETSTGHQPSSELSIRKKKQIRENKITQDNGNRQEVMLLEMGVLKALEQHLYLRRQDIFLLLKRR